MLTPVHFVSTSNNWLAVESEEPVSEKKKDGTEPVSQLKEAQSAPSGLEVPAGMRPFPWQQLGI